MERMNMVFNCDYWDKVASVKEFNRICHGYPTEEQFYSFTEPIDNLNKDTIFLDIGCGPGRIIKTVAPSVKEYYGIDVSGNMINIAKDKHWGYKNVYLFKNDGNKLSIFENNKFNYIYERLVFIHVPKNWIVSYMEEISRVLMTGGILNIPDFPREDKNVNGFSLEEIQTMLKTFSCVNIKSVGNTYEIRGVK